MAAPLRREGATGTRGTVDLNPIILIGWIYGFMLVVYLLHKGGTT